MNSLSLFVQDEFGRRRELKARTPFLVPSFGAGRLERLQIQVDSAAHGGKQTHNVAGMEARLGLQLQGRFTVHFDRDATRGTWGVIGPDRQDAPPHSDLVHQPSFCNPLLLPPLPHSISFSEPDLEQLFSQLGVICVPLSHPLCD